MLTIKTNDFDREFVQDYMTDLKIMDMRIYTSMLKDICSTLQKFNKYPLNIKLATTPVCYYDKDNDNFNIDILDDVSINKLLIDSDEYLCFSIVEFKDLMCTIH